MNSLYRLLRQRTGLVIGLVAVLLVSTIGTASYFVAQNAHAQRPTPPRTDHRAEQKYWAQRLGNPTGQQLAAAHAQAAKLPSGTLPPANHRYSSGKSGLPGSPSGVWHAMGPAPINVFDFTNYAGRVSALAVDQTTSGASTTIYLGAAGGGVWKSVNNGASWTPLTDAQASMATGALAIDPNNHNIIYAGTGEANQSLDSYYGSGVLKSTNGGASWTLLGSATFGTRSSAISKIAVDPHNSSRIFAATTLGFYVSNDGGSTWNLPSNYPNCGFGCVPQADDLSLDTSTNPSTVYVTVRGIGMYKSTNGGSTLTALTTGLPASSNWHRSVVAVAPSNPQVVYTIITQDDFNGHVYTGAYNGGYYTTDGGAHWSPMVSLNQDFTASGSEAQGWYDLYLAVDPKNDQIVYGGGIDVALTTNARGASGNWTNITQVYGVDYSGIHPDQHAIAFPACSAAPCPVYLGNDGGIYYSNTTTTSASKPGLPGSGTGGIGPSYIDLNTTGLAISEFTGGDIGPNFVNSRLATGGTQDNGTMEYGGGSGVSTVWSEVEGGDGGFAAIDPTNPQVQYGEFFGISLYKTNNDWADGGFSANSGIGGNSLFYTPFVLDRVHTNHLVAGTDSVYETVNGASSWYQSSPVLSGGTSISAVAVAQGNSSVIYAGLTDGEVFRTTNGNTGSAATYTPAGSFGSHYVTSIAVDPNDPTGNTAYVTTGFQYSVGYDNVGHVFRTTNGGASWTDITGSLPQFPVNSIVVYISGSTRVLVVGTDFGVFYSTNEGANWYQLNAYLPNAPVVQLALDVQRSTIIAYTHGRSAFNINVPESTGGTGDTIGVYHGSTFFLRNEMSAGFAEEVANFGTSSMIPIAGDWAGDGISRVGAYDPSTGVFWLSSANTSGAPLYASFPFGPHNCKPVVGDWTGKGSDGVGVDCNGVFYLRNSLNGGPADFVMTYGSAGDTPVAGDWTGQGHATIGVYHPSTGVFYLTNSVCTCNPAANYGVVFGPPNSYPFTGDWTHAGHTGLGVLYPANGVLYAKNDATHAGYSDFNYVFGSPSDRPVAGHWV